MNIGKSRLKQALQSLSWFNSPAWSHSPRYDPAQASAVEDPVLHSCLPRKCLDKSFGTGTATGADCAPTVTRSQSPAFTSLVVVKCGHSFDPLIVK